MFRRATALLVCALAAAPLLTLREPAIAAESRVPSTIEATAEAEVEAPADLAIVELGVLTQAQTAAAATSRNAEQMQAVLAALRKMLGSDARIETGSYSVGPDYARGPEGGPAQVVVGYTGRNVVRIITADLARVGTVVDTAIAAGGNRVQRIS